MNKKNRLLFYLVSASMVCGSCYGMRRTVDDNNRQPTIFNRIAETIKAPFGLGKVSTPDQAKKEAARLIELTKTQPKITVPGLITEEAEKFDKAKTAEKEAMDGQEKIGYRVQAFFGFKPTVERARAQTAASFAKMENFQAALPADHSFKQINLEQLKEVRTSAVDLLKKAPTEIAPPRPPKPAPPIQPPAIDRTKKPEIEQVAPPIPPKAVAVLKERLTNKPPAGMAEALKTEMEKVRVAEIIKDKGTKLSDTIARAVLYTANPPAGKQPIMPSLKTQIIAALDVARSTMEKCGANENLIARTLKEAQKKITSQTSADTDKLHADQIGKIVAEEVIAAIEPKPATPPRKK